VGRECWILRLPRSELKRGKESSRRAAKDRILQVVKPSREKSKASQGEVTAGKRGRSRSLSPWKGEEKPSPSTDQI